MLRTTVGMNSLLHHCVHEIRNVFCNYCCGSCSFQTPSCWYYISQNLFHLKPQWFCLCVLNIWLGQILHEMNFCFTSYPKLCCLGESGFWSPSPSATVNYVLSQHLQRYIHIHITELFCEINLWNISNADLIIFYLIELVWLHPHTSCMSHTFLNCILGIFLSFRYS